MSDRQLTFTQELDLWIEDAIILPLWDTERDDKRWPEVVDKVYESIHAMVLKGFHAGQKAGPKATAPHTNFSAR